MPDLKPGKSKWIEWALIMVAIGVYCLPFLDLGTTHTLPGLEAGYFQTFDNILELSIEKYGEFPLWNPYFSTGIPYVADPMLHIYNPLTSLPALLFGTTDGFKIAVFLGFIVAGLGMWWLGKELGLGALGRIWLALMYAFSGVPAAKFIQGHYLMVFGFGWIPFSLAAIMAARRSKRWTDICLAALGLALLFLSGNGYYAYYMLYVIALYAIIMLFSLKTRPFELKVDLGTLKVLFCIGLLSLGLIAIQLLPVVEYRDRYLKPYNLELSDSQSTKDVFLDFTFPAPFRPGAYSYILRPEEFYAYIGWWPLIGMLLIPIAWKKKDKHKLVFFLSLIAFTFLWIDVKDMPWKNLFKELPFLYQFRYPSRMVVIGSMSLITVGGLGLDSLVKWASGFKTAGMNENYRRLIYPGVVFALGVFMAYSVIDLVTTSRPLLQTFPKEPQDEVAHWLREFDPGIYYIETPSDWQETVIKNNLRYLKGNGPILDISRSFPQISERPIEAGSKYVISSNDSEVPENATLIKSFDTLKIYKMDNSLPFAFTLSTATLTTPGENSLSVDEVTPVTTFTADINSFEGNVTSDSLGALILVSKFNPNWQLTLDGKPTKIYNAYGYLAAEVNPGTHHYRFVYKPVWFYVGLTISIATSVVMFVVWAVLLYQNRLARMERYKAHDQFHAQAANEAEIGHTGIKF